MTEPNVYNIGLDVGSTTAKLVVAKNQTIVHKQYERHNTDIFATVESFLEKIRTEFGNIQVKLNITGSAGMGLSERFKLPFIQEVIATTEVIRKKYPETGTLIDIGGEDSKMIFFSEGKTPDIRMNGSCAGGTGAFIDQIASLLGIPVSELNGYAENYEKIFPIASRCGVFAKTDVQNLLSRKVSKEDIIASVFYAVAIQALNTLSRGYDVQKKVIFSGGPFTFIPELGKHFRANLKITEADVIEVENPELLPAMGAALAINGEHVALSIDEILEKFRNKVGEVAMTNRLLPLFSGTNELEEWKNKLKRYTVPRMSLAEYNEDIVFLGIDSGSTTTKMVLLGTNSELLYTYYNNNKGNPIEAVEAGIKQLLKEVSLSGKQFTLGGSAVTGYGEDLIKAAFNLNQGIVETIAHFQGAKHFNKDVSFILDIGGQDMKAIFISNDSIEKIELNESCSSGCGSFIQTFGEALGVDVADFAHKSCLAESPCDLGTRCTVFMNSKVKQSLKENAKIEDIGAGLAASVIKNALYKVLKIRTMDDLGTQIVVQGGTFKNAAVLRALEIETGKEIVCSDIPELMGAFGAALHAQELSTKGDAINIERLSEISSFNHRQIVCKGCNNNCIVTRYSFGNKNTFYSGNKCEKIYTNKGEGAKSGANYFSIKQDLLFNRRSLDEGIATIGIPRVLNLFDSYPFWHTLFTEAGVKVVLSDESSMKMYQLGQGTVMSDSICFPAKIVHGHIFNLASKEVERIFYPQVVYEKDEFTSTENSYNCPIVSGYPDVIKSAVNPERRFGIPIDAPVVSFRDSEMLHKTCKKYLKSLGVRKSAFEKAFKLAMEVQNDFKETLKTEASNIIQQAFENNELLVVMAGRPYHVDSLINHRTPEILAELGAHVLPEDAIPFLPDESFPAVQVITQWAFPNRIYKAAQWVALQPDNVQLVQINSFGCGPDAIVIDEATDILKEKGKNLTLIRVDEISSTGSVKLRLRSMIESLKLSRNNKRYLTRNNTASFKLEDKRRTIIAPVFSEVYSAFFPAIFELSGYKLVNLPIPNKESVEFGLKYCNNEVCYPATIVIGDIIKALKSGNYNREEIAVGITQTGGQCRATSYLSLIKKGMVAAGFEDIPVVAIGTEGITINDQPGFELDWNKIMKVCFVAALYGDGLSNMFHATAVREIETGASKKLLDKYIALAHKAIVKNSPADLLTHLQAAVKEFNQVKVQPGNYPKIGIVGEIYVKYNSFGNRNVVDWLISQGVEPVVPPLVDFFTQVFVNFDANRRENLSKRKLSDLYIYYIEFLAGKYQNKLNRILSKFRFNTPFHDIRHISKLAGQVINLANQYGEGWLIPAEIAAFAEDKVYNVVSLQPFGCIANHVISKGIEKKLRDIYPEVNILYLDFDDGTSEVNVLNRLHYMVKNVKDQHEA